VGSSGSPNLQPPGQPSDSPFDVESARIQTIANVTSFSFHEVEPPSPLYVQRDDTMVILAAANPTFGNANVTFALRMLLTPFAQGGQPGEPKNLERYIREGTIQTIQNVLLASGGVGPQTDRIILTEGYLLSVAAYTQGVARRGAVFARAYLIRSPNGPVSGIPVLPLFADYIGIYSPIGWPGGRWLWPEEGAGTFVSATVANPGAGADWTFTAPGTTQVRIIGTSATLTTSAAVANRVPELIFDDGAAPPFAFGTPNQSVPASQTVKVGGTNAPMGAAANVADVMVSIPQGIILRPGSRISSNTINIQGADQWSNIRVYAEQLIDGA
jgi:hypothetical protein